MKGAQPEIVYPFLRGTAIISNCLYWILCLVTMMKELQMPRSPPQFYAFSWLITTEQNSLQRGRVKTKQTSFQYFYYRSVGPLSESTSSFLLFANSCSSAVSTSASTGVSDNLRFYFSSHNMLLVYLCVCLSVSFANSLIPKKTLREESWRGHYLEMQFNQ